MLVELLGWLYAMHVLVHGVLFLLGCSFEIVAENIGILWCSDFHPAVISMQFKFFVGTSSPMKTNHRVYVLTTLCIPCTVLLKKYKVKVQHGLVWVVSALRVCHILLWGLE